MSVSSASPSASWSKKATPTASGSGIRVVESENDFPMQRIDRIRVGSAHVVVRDDVMTEVAMNVMRSLARQINGQFDPAAADQMVEVVAK